MYQLTQESELTRVYTSQITGTEVETYVLQTTPETGEKWWTFRDLISIPFIRKKAAEQVTSLYGAGITKADLDSLIASMKDLLRANDPEKYEKIYSEILQLEKLSNQTADPVKQSLSLCTVYIMADKERIDNFSMKDAANKMEQWSLQPDLQAFFLSFLTDHMNNYAKSYTELSAIASALK